MITESDPTMINHGSRRIATSLALTLALATGGVQASEAAPEAHPAGVADCLRYSDTSKYKNHQYEVCVAYAANAATVALQGLYKFGNNSTSYLADPAKHHFETRYWGTARRSTEQEVGSWPETKSPLGNKVKQDVDVVSVTSSLKADRGLVRTREAWAVTTRGGKVLHREQRHNKDITMCRGKLPGHILHAWFVVKFNRDPNFNCIKFDKEHGLKP